MKKPTLLTLFLVVLIDLIGFGIVIPILPYYALKFGATGWTIGWLMTSYSLFQFLFSPFWGGLSDRIGRRPVLLISIVGSFFAYLILAQATSLTFLFLGRILGGFFAANISIAYAYVSDVTDEKNRTKGMGLIGAAFGIGFVLGPALGGALSPWGYDIPMYAGAVLALLNFVFAFRSLPESRPSHLSTKKIPRLQLLKKLPPVWLPIFLFFCTTFAITQMEVIFAIFMKAQYQFSAKQAGYLLAYLGVLMALIQGGGIGRLSKLFGEKNLILLGSFFGALALTSYALTTKLELAIFSLSIMAIGHGLLYPSLASVTSKRTPHTHRGAVMGIFHSSSSLSRILAPPLAGWLYDHLSIESPFFCASIFLFLVFVISFYLKTISPPTLKAQATKSQTQPL